MTILARDVPAPEPRVPGAASSTRARVGRIASVDVLRGVAIIAVVVYHGLWDLSAFGLAPAWTSTPLGHAIGRGIAGMFLMLVGVSMALVHNGTLHPRALAARIGKLVIAGLAVTAVSGIAYPQYIVTFGILQNIAVTSVLLVPFLWCDRLVPLGAAGVAVVLPKIIALQSSPWTDWTGLTGHEPSSVDFQPLLPMFGLSLLGLVIGQTFARSDPAHTGTLGALVQWRPRGPVRWVDSAGRHTLAIYLMHQPVLYAVLFATSAVRWH